MIMKKLVRILLLVFLLLTSSNGQLSGQLLVKWFEGVVTLDASFQLLPTCTEVPHAHTDDAPASEQGKGKSAGDRYQPGPDAPSGEHRGHTGTAEASHAHTDKASERGKGEDAPARYQPTPKDQPDARSDEHGGPRKRTAEAAGPAGPDHPSRSVSFNMTDDLGATSNNQPAATSSSGFRSGSKGSATWSASWGSRRRGSSLRGSRTWWKFTSSANSSAA